MGPPTGFPTAYNPYGFVPPPPLPVFNPGVQQAVSGAIAASGANLYDNNRADDTAFIAAADGAVAALTSMGPQYASTVASLQSNLAVLKAAAADDPNAPYDPMKAQQIAMAQSGVRYALMNAQYANNTNLSINASNAAAAAYGYLPPAPMPYGPYFLPPYAPPYMPYRPY